eukprot:8947361-Prorocentrum_lima.AAC.1
MITIEVPGRTITASQIKLRAHPDPWHDVDILGLEGRDLAPSQDVSASGANQKPPPRGSRPGSSAD